jgi:hypothetical protein
MQTNKFLRVGAICGLLAMQYVVSAQYAKSQGRSDHPAVDLKSDVGVGSQYDSTHVYVAPGNVDRFVMSFLGTFGGQSSKQVITTVTPTPSRTTSQILQTPVGIVSLFGFETPIPFPFGSERTGYLVKNIDEAIQLAREAGADVLVAPFPDPIGRDAIVQWPGGVNTQLYWHTTPLRMQHFEPFLRIVFMFLPIELMRSCVAFSLSRMAGS